MGQRKGGKRARSVSSSSSSSSSSTSSSSSGASSAGSKRRSNAYLESQAKWLEVMRQRELDKQRELEEEQARQRKAEEERLAAIEEKKRAEEQRVKEEEYRRQQEIARRLIIGNKAQPSSTEGGITVGSRQPATSTALVVGMQSKITAREVLSAMLMKAREGRRIHVSNMPITATDEEVTNMFFTQANLCRRELMEKQLKQYGRRMDPGAVVDVDPILHQYVNRDGTTTAWGFLEFANEDIVAEVLKLPMTMEGPPKDPTRSYRRETYTLKMGRPRDYEFVDVHSDDRVGRDPCKLVVLGVPSAIDSDTIKELFGAFGTIEDFQAVGDKYYFVAYTDSKAADDAIADLHGEKLGQRLVVVQRASEQQKMQFALDTGRPYTLPAKSDGEQADEEDQKAELERLGVEEGGKSMMKDLMSLTCHVPQALLHFKSICSHYKDLSSAHDFPIYPSRVLVLLNCIDVSELEDDEDYSNLLTDLSDELEKYGRVVQLLVPRTAPPVPMPPVPPRVRTPPARRAHDESAASDDVAASSNNDASRELVTFKSEEDDEVMKIYKEQQERDDAEYNAAVEKFQEERLAWEHDRIHPVKGGVGRVVVEYMTVDEAEAAQRALAGRLFSQRTIVTTFFPEYLLYPHLEPKEGEDPGKSNAELLAILGGDSEDEENAGDSNNNGDASLHTNGDRGEGLAVGEGVGDLD